MRTKSYFVLILLTFPIFTMNAQEPFVRSLTYSRITSGLTQPQFKSGRTDFAMADMNLDGHVDILTIGDHGSPGTDQNGIMIWLGDGKGNFTLHKNGNFGYGGIATGDVNNDGLPDVAYGMHHNYSGIPFGDQLIEVALGDGTGTNWTPWDFGLASAGEDWGMFGTALADFNNDGLLDLVSVSFGCCNGVQVYLNQGDGSWVHSFGIIGGNSDLNTETGDFNKDGYMDFVATIENGLVYFGDGTGDFILHDTGLPVPSGWMLSGVSVGDVDKDGADDISFVNSEGGLDVYHWSAGQSAWLSLSGNLPTTGDFQFTQLADMNTDGKVDLLAYGKKLMQIWLGNGNGDWMLATSFETPGQMGNGRALRSYADLDHNGYPDIVLLTQEGTWITNKNNLYVYAENSPAVELWLLPQFPAGEERFYAQSVRMIRWSAQVPLDIYATVTIYFSQNGPDGPWVTIAEQLPNNGLYQWNIPEAASDNCYLKYDLITENETYSFVQVNPFSILGPVTLNDQHTPLINNSSDFFWPNPAHDFIFWPKELKVHRLMLFDHTGRMILELKSPDQNIKLSGLVNGTYYYQAETNQSLFTGKLIKL